MNFEHWLLKLSRPKQYILALIMLGISTWSWFCGWIWPYGWIFGFILLCWSCFAPQRKRDDLDEDES